MTSRSFAFGLPRGFAHPSGKYAEPATGATKLAFADEAFSPSAGLFRPNRRAEAAAGVELALVVADVETAHDRALAAGAEPALAPAVKPWGQTVSYVRDLNGVLVEACSAVGAD